MKWRLIFAGFLLATGSLCQFSIDVNTDLVTVTVTASDMNGQPAEDLKANDFRVTEDGKPQQVAIFLYRKLDIDEPLAEIPAARPTSPEGVRTQTVSARWTQPDNLVHRRLLAMVFDFSTMAIPAQAHVRQSAIDFIRKDLKPADLATVMATTGGKLEILQNFTDDRAALAAAVSKVRGGDQPDSDILSAHGKLIAIEDACRQLSAPRLVGNKALLYFSDRFPLPGLYIQTAWTNTANRCIRANTAIYPITEANDSLSKLAAITGGSVLRPRSDMTASMESARDKIGNHYVVGYYSTNLRPDGAYRKVNVETIHGGTLLHYRHGYFADTYLWFFRR